MLQDRPGSWVVKHTSSLFNSSKASCTLLLHVLPYLDSFENRLTWPYSKTVRIIKNSHETKKLIVTWKVMDAKASKKVKTLLLTPSALAYCRQHEHAQVVRSLSKRKKNCKWTNLRYLLAWKTQFFYWYFRSSRASFQNTLWCQPFSAQEADAVKWIKLRRSKGWTGGQLL